MKRHRWLTHPEGHEVQVPTVWAICDACDGEGKSSAYLGAFTQSELDERGQEFIEDYKAGNYDRTCEECKGAGKVQKLVEDEDQLTQEQREALEEHYKYQQELAWERSMRARGMEW